MAIIESYVTPQRLYRYRSLEKIDRELDAIKEGYLYCPAYKDLNDPMEGLFRPSQTLQEGGNYPEVRTAIMENKDQIGICSFSEVYKHELMWAHYANKFTGICVAYSLRLLLDNLSDNFSFVRMYYNEEEPRVTSTTNDPAQLAKMVLSYKNYRWLYEREWRLFARQGRAYYKKKKCVTRVYLGFRMEHDARTKVMKSLGDSNIATSNMSIDKYSMSFSERR